MTYIYRENLIISLKSLADYDFQKIAWFDNDQGLWYPFHEAVEETFHEGFIEACNVGEVVFSKKADIALQDLEKACDALGYNWDGREKELLESGGMKNIRIMAKKCLQLIEESNPLESTIQFIAVGTNPLENP